VALLVDSPALEIDWEYAVGLADPGRGEEMTPEHPVRIASNTKTYVAAAVLRLWEQDRLDLGDPIAKHLPPEFLSTLESDGYDPKSITIRHLLTHTSGLFDHGASEQYGDDIVADPVHRWTRSEQLQICVDAGDPLGEPGQVYNYSDTGYILLGKILEDVTGLNLAEAVWSLVDRERLGLDSTWFETLEPRPERTRERAHQFFGELDVTGFDPSFDLWGGGGIATTVGDLAEFTRSLFTGEVFEDPKTLEAMLTTFDGLRPAPGASERALPPGAYRMGVWVLPADGYTVYRHTGFWCTSATWVPELDLVVTLTVNQHEARELFTTLQDGVLEIVNEYQ
jgi:D-alanyl-D-alanine carboxypeptidase